MEPTGVPAGYEAYDDEQRHERVGFFTDTSICIGCKACEVACKEWNLLPDDGFDLLGQSFDNTGALDANSWRHVAFIEQQRPPRASADTMQPDQPARRPVDLGIPSMKLP